MTVQGHADLFWWVPALLGLATMVGWPLAWWLTSRRWPAQARPRLRRFIRVVLVVVAIVLVASFLYEVFVPTTCIPGPCRLF